MRMVGAVVGAVGIALGATLTLADGFPGAGSFTGTSKLKVSGCGKLKTSAEMSATVAADGSWQVADGERVFRGAGSIRGKGRRGLALEPDAETLTSFADRIAEGASALCETTVTSNEVDVRKGRLKVNGKGSRARLLLVVGASVDDGTGTPRNAKLRVVGAAPWEGPLSCEEIFACTELCPEDDPTCIDGCLSQGSLATQEAVRALTTCVDVACPLGDPVCVANAIAGVCKDEFEACVPPPPPTNLTCEEVLECADECGGQRCVDDCFDRGSEAGREEATAVSRCVGRVCPGGGAVCAVAALAYACAYVWEDCSGTTPRRNFSCGEILSCQSTCASNACRADCFARGSTSGQSQLESLDACITAACPTRDPVCVGNTVTGQCKAQWEECLG